MFILGLTGGIGSGKSAASAAFEKLGVNVVDADIVARDVVEPGSVALLEISNHYGPEILTQAQTLDRAKLRDIIFTNALEKQWLESLLHPLIRAEIESRLRNATSSYAILVSPLLLETDQLDLVDRVLLIDAPVELQIQRAVARDDKNREQIEDIIRQQLPRKCKIKKADDIICNDKDLNFLESQVQRLHQTYLELADAN